MNSKPEGAGARACWFVGASYGGTDDQTPRFLEEGIWQNGYQDKYLDDVKSIKPGDRIAIKSSYTRKHSLPFDNRGQTVSEMAIKAIGIVKENLGDGRNLKVDWTSRIDPPRKWYFYTHRGTVWRVLPGDWTTDALIGFTFDEKPQDINRFRNAPYWRERFGDGTVDKRRFIWTGFYEAVANKLISFRDKRGELVTGIHAIAARVDGLSNLQDQFKDGTTGPLKDICPFTTIGIFNRGITEINRKNIAAELAKFLDVEEPVPESFEGTVPGSRGLLEYDAREVSLRFISNAPRYKPVNLLAAFRGPTLIIHPGADAHVPLAHARIYQAAGGRDEAADHHPRRRPHLQFTCLGTRGHHAHRRLVPRAPLTRRRGGGLPTPGYVIPKSLRRQLLGQAGAPARRTTGRAPNRSG